MPPLKLRSKLALWYAALFVVLLGASGIAVFELVGLRLKAEADDNLVDHMAGLWGYIHFDNAKPSVVYDSQNEYSTYFLREATRYYQIYDGQTGDLLLESEDSALMHLALGPDQFREVAAQPGIDTLARGQMPLRFRSAMFQANGHSYLVRAGVSIETDLEVLSELRTALLWLVPLTTIIAVFGAWWMAGHSLRPLRDLEREAASISITRLSRRLPQRGTKDELDSLAATFNEVLSRLDASVRQMRDFADFMAHELRTPMTVLRGEVQVELMRSDLPDEWRSHLESHLEEFEKLNRVIDRFLLIAKAETGGIQLEKQTVSLSDLARTMVEMLEPVAEGMGIRLCLISEDKVEVLADRAWIERALFNLLDNAMKFTLVGGLIRITVQNDPSGGLIEIADNGCGISPNDLPYIFDRFYRSKDSGSSHRAPGGLGLSLTKWIVEQHQGNISVESITDKGTTFTIILPHLQQETA
jgi:heavy metal sensor kinase